MLAGTSQLSQLLAAARAGCRESLGRVFQDCTPYVLDIARREVPPNLLVKGSASDLVQETFLEAVNGFDHFSGESEAQLKAWLRQLLRRIFKLFRRYRGRKSGASAWKSRAPPRMKSADPRPRSRPPSRRPAPRSSRRSRRWPCAGPWNTSPTTTAA